ncbi:MAG: hypothetical protein WAN35_04985 [Terracidiphilus sp.]
MARIILYVLLFSGIVTLIWLHHPRWKVLYDDREVLLNYRETGRDIQIRISAPSNIFPSFAFDYWQDGLHHKRDMLTPSKSRVELEYSVVENGALCAQYVVADSGSQAIMSTTCGGLKTSASVIDFIKNPDRWDYTIVLPKNELSSDGKSANMVIDFWDESKQSHSSYPTSRFVNPVHLSYLKSHFEIIDFLDIR